MLFELDNGFKFPIPFPTILPHQQQPILKLHRYRLNYHTTSQQDKHQDQSDNRRKHLFGELKLSDRQTIIILCYLLTSMATPTPKPDDAPRTVLYLCKSRERAQWVLKALQKLLAFLDKQLTKLDCSIADIKVYQQSKEIQVKIAKARQGREQNEEEDREEISDREDKDKPAASKARRFFVMPLNQYMAFKLEIRELMYWEHIADASMQMSQKQSINNILLKVYKNIDVLVAETNDLQGILEDLFSITLSETILNRSWMELTKLNRFYNFRLNNKSREKTKSKQKETRENEPLPKKQLQGKVQRKVQKKAQMKGQGANNESLQKSNLQLLIQKDEEVRFQAEKKQPQKKAAVWHVQNFDAKFSQLAKNKQMELKNINQGPYARIGIDRIQTKHLQCHFLIQLQAITHLVASLVSSFKQKDLTDLSETQMTSQQYILLIAKRINIASAHFRKFRRILKKFIAEYPPKVYDKVVSTNYLDQLLKFVEKLVIWHQMFIKLPTDEVFAAGSNRFWVFKYKHEQVVPLQLKQSKQSKRVKEQLIKLTTFDHKIMMQLLCEGAKSISCFQNHGVSFDYYHQVFKPHKRFNIGIEYRSPKVACKEMATIGLIVNSTPNDEDLHIYSDKPNWSLQQNDSEDKKFDRENYSQIIRAYGVLVYDLCQTIADGIVVYFPNRKILRECRAQWQAKQNIYERIYQKKRIFQEVEQSTKNTANLKLYKKLCDCGRGAVFFVSAQSQFSKNQTFFGHYSRTIVFMGVPYSLIEIQIQAKVHQLRLKQSYRFEVGMKMITRCLSNCINDLTEIKTVLFADASFEYLDIRKKWFPFIEDGNLNTSDVIDKVKRINSGNYQRQDLEEQKNPKQPSLLVLSND